MPDITANAPDGTKHVFPDGTDPTVIDRVMKEYITGKKSAPAQPPTPQPSTWDTVKRVGQEGTLGALSGFTGLPETQSPVTDFLKSAFTPPKSAKQVMESPLLTGGIPAIQGVEKVIDWGKRIKEGMQQKDPSMVANTVGNIAGTAAQVGTAFAVPESLKAPVTEAGKAIQRHLAIDQGKVRVVNDMVRQPLAKLDAAVSNEIGRSVNQAIQADEMDMQSKGTKAGQVDVSKGPAAARAKIGLTAKEISNQGDTLISRGESKPMMTLRDAKSYTTDVGRAASAAKRAGNAREALALDALYDGLHEATKDRATDLGQGKIWQHYIDETRNYKNMQGGLLGELVDEPIHAKALDKLTNPQRATEASEISQALKKYGIDPATFDKAKELGIDLNRYAQETKANFMGKIKAIIKHPMAAGGAAVGASMVGSATGLPGMSLVLPIIVAGKVANMLDAASLKSLLNDIKGQVPLGAERVNPPLEGPTAAGPSAAPPSVPRGTTPMGAPERRIAERGEVNKAILDQLHGELRKATTPEAKARVQRNIKDLQEQGVTAESDIAGMLKDQYKFTDTAAKSVVQSIRGKYSSLDEGLKMAMAEAIKRTKGAKR